MDIQREILGAFQAEHKEQVEGIRAILASMEQQAATPRDARWDEAFRMAHTLKGGARVCDLQGVESLGHRMESLFACVREGSLPFDAKVADTIYHALDAIEDWMATFSAGNAPASPAETLEAIEQLLQAAKSSPPPAAKPGASEPPAPPVADAPAPPVGQQEIETLRVHTQHLDTVLRSTDALLAVQAEQDRAAGEFARLAAQTQDLQRECELIRASSAPLLRRLESTAEFGVIARHVDSVAQHARRLARQRRVALAAQQRSAWMLRGVSDDLRRAVQHTRMVAAENIFQGLRTTVRNLARDEGKEVEFRAAGLNVQADRMVLQALKDPLLHALRNAVVHGIELPDERVAQGKNRLGQIALTLRTVGNRLQVLVEDDGRGVDLDRVGQEAINRGFLSATNPETEMGREELRRVLFRPGFSTSSAVTELAGRGMGLSVVHETIARLRGTVRIGPRGEAGTVLEMSAPLMVTAERLLLVTAGEQTFALPVNAIDRLLRVPRSEVKSVEGRQIALAEGLPMPLIGLSQALGGAASSASRGDLLSVVVLRTATHRVGVVVDTLLSEREALIKDLDGPAAEVQNFSGAILLDDSRVALVVNPAALTDGHSIAPALTQPKEAEPAVQAATILVVDDSFTTRTLEKNILETNGYNVRVAVDGLEALKVLRSEPVCVVVADVQMPRMDGLSLLKEIRRDAAIGSLPVILVTSLDGAEDRRRGLALGANAYIIKRKFDHHELLHTIRKFL